jgi:hypothetical protein
VIEFQDRRDELLQSAADFDVDIWVRPKWHTAVGIVDPSMERLVLFGNR